MARLKGQSTFIKIPLSALVERLKDTPNIKIAVSKGNLAELSSALDADFSEFLPDAVPASETAQHSDEDAGDAPLGGMSVD